MKEIKDEAFKFLLYSYFGAEEINEDIKEKCAYRAYLDLARTMEYTHKTSESDKDFKDKYFDGKKDFEKEKEKAVKNVDKIIIKRIEKFSDKHKFDIWHKALCEEIIKMMKEACDGKLVEAFTYGHAQKWLNMTLKYMWMLDLLPKDINEDDLHVPIDSYIIEAIFGKKISEDLWLEIDGKLKPESSWSKWGCDEYTTLQAAIEKGRKNKSFNSRIDWESKAWVAVAEKKNK